MIEEKFNYTFLIRNNDINLNERISIDMSNRSVEEILTTALKNQHADFVVNNNRIVVYKSSSNPNELRNTERMVAQQTITISGTIVDDNRRECARERHYERYQYRFRWKV